MIRYQRMINPTIWNQLLVWPMLNLLVAFYKAFTVIHLPGAFGFAIIALTLLIRGVLSPLTRKQLESARAMSKLKPKIDELSRAHKDDKVKLQQAQMQLYKDAGVNPTAGCLPLLVQMPLFIALYNVFNQVLASGTTENFIGSLNSILYHPALHIPSLDLNFFGVNLAAKPSQWQQLGIWMLAIPVVTGLLQYVQTKMMTAPAPAGAITPEKKEGAGAGDAMADAQKQMALMMPIMIGFFAFSFPVGLALYWNTFSLFAIIQQRAINNKR